MSKKHWITNLTSNKGEKRLPYMALYGLFRQDPDGTIQGYIENSFSMGWSTERVRLWGKSNAQHYLNEHVRKCKKYGNPDNTRFFIYRLTRRSPNARIIADLKGRMEEIQRCNRNFIFRNCKFTVNAGDSVG